MGYQMVHQMGCHGQKVGLEEGLEGYHTDCGTVHQDS
jgi:hypothetical protein